MNKNFNTINYWAIVFLVFIGNIVKYVYEQIPIKYSGIAAIFTIFGLIILLNRLFAKNHFIGMKLLQAGQFKEAIPYFEKKL